MPTRPNTILLHAEKISNGQFDFIEVLHNELKNKLGVDGINPLIDSLKKNEVADVHNQTRLFLAQFNFIIEGDDVNYRLVKLSDNACELDIISGAENLDSKELVSTQKVNLDNTSTPTLEQRVVKIQFHLQNMANSAIIIGQELTECKKLVGHGNWQNWLQKNFNLSQRSARQFMQIAERFSKNSEWQTSAVLSTSQMIEMLALPEGEEEKFIAEKSAAGTPVEDMTVKTLRAEIKNWKAEAEKNKKESQKYKAESEEKSAEIEQLKNNPVSVLPPDYEATKKKFAELQATISQLQNNLAQKTVEIIPPEDYESNKEKIVELNTKIQQLENKLGKSADVVPRSDFEKLQKELHQLKLQQNPIFTSPTTTQFRTFYDLSETLSLKLLHPDSDLDYCIEYFDQDSIRDLIANLQSITVDLEKIAKKKWG